MGSGQAYRGRLAPSPTGYLHLGHARTFWIAAERAREAQGTLILRVEDIDRARCKPDFVSGMMADLAWFGFKWQEGPDVGGPFAPYKQSERFHHYEAALKALRDAGVAYPCSCSRQDVLRALSAPHAGEEEPVYPGTCRNRTEPGQSRRCTWRFRVPDGETVAFIDGRLGRQSFVAGKDFGDFVLWRSDGVPSYQLAVVVDDAAMQITEVVRGEDLLLSTARQLLLYQSLGFRPPDFYHCPLVVDGGGVRLAKRHEALSLKTLREQGRMPEKLRASWQGGCDAPG